jgi:hypothetical protein
MEIQALKPGKWSLTLDASRIIQRTQQTEFPLDATTTFSNNWPCLQMKPGKNHQPPLLGFGFQIPAKSPLMMPRLSTKQVDQSVPIIPTKGWNVRFLAFLGWVGGPEPSTKTRPPDLWLLVSPLLVSPCLIVSRLVKQLRNFQLLN